MESFKITILYLFFVIEIVVFSGCGIVRSVVMLAPNTNDYRHDPQALVANGDKINEFHETDQHTSLSKKIKISLQANQKMELDSFSKMFGTEAFLIIRNDSILYEAYSPNKDNRTRVSSFSISKAIVTTLVGVAINEGFLKSTNQNVGEFLPEWKEKGFRDLQIKHLMQHTSGMRFNKSIYNPTSDQVQFYYGRNLYRRMKRRKPEMAPGENFDYQSANTILLSLLLEKATGMPITDYLETRIWIPLGMESSASWSLDRKGKKGVVRTFCCLQAIARDFAKLGKLWLQDGQWKNSHLLPEGFMQSILKSPNSKGRYRSGFRIVSNDSNIFYTSGLLGQYIYLFPDKNLMILRFGEHRERYSGRLWRKAFMDIAAQL